MRHVVHRCGLLAVWLSYKANKQTIGICITASHNPPEDNGVKFINWDGHMLEEDLEVCASEFVNAKDPLNHFAALFSELGVDLRCASQSDFSGCSVYCGRDTRDTSAFLSNCAKAAAECLGAAVVDLGLTTTPQVHFAVRNMRNLHLDRTNSVISLNAYYEHFSRRFSQFLRLCGLAGRRRHLPERLVCDGANGVGATNIEAFRRVLKDDLNVELEIRNDGRWPGDMLNWHCGTDWVQREQRLPHRFGQ